MKTFWCGVGIVAMAIMAARAQAPAPTDQDKAAVRQAAYDYGEGFYEGAADRMARGVHPAIIKRGVMTRRGFGPVLVPMNAETLVELTRQRGAKATPPDKRNIVFELLDIRDAVASARIFTSGFNDYLHLVKQDGNWRIVHVLWQPPSPSGVANAPADKAAVAQVVKDVLEALSAGDVARLERTIHSEAALRTFRADSPTGRIFLSEGNRDSFMGAAREKVVPPMPDAAVTVLDVYDTIASALTTTQAGLFYWHLAKQNDQWRVVNLLRR